MSRPVSIGTGVCEIIGGSVQTVFAVGGILILLDPFAIELRIQVHKSVHHDQRSRPNLHLYICIILYHSAFWQWMTNEYSNDLVVCRYWSRLFWVVWVFGSSLEITFIRTLLKRFKENSLNFCGLWGKQDLTKGPRRTVSSTGASVDFFWQHAACSKKGGVQRQWQQWHAKLSAIDRPLLLKTNSERSRRHSMRFSAAVLHSM